MTLGVRGKLFAVSLALVLAVGLSSAVWLEGELRTWLEQRIEAELLQDAHTARVAVQSAGGPGPRDADALAKRLGGATGTRITLIAQDGRVVGDSEVDSGAIAAMEDHGSRPEVVDARRSGHSGRARRHSATLGTDMLYVALPFSREADAETGFVRAAVPLADVDVAVARLRGLIALAGAVGLLVALAMSFLASSLLSRALTDLADRARTLRKGGRVRGLPTDRRDELGSLARSFRVLSSDLERSMTALSDERDRFEAVLEGMRQAVVALDGEQRVSLLNERAEELLGVRADAVGKPLVEVVRVPDLLDLIERSATGESGSFDEIELSGPPRRSLLARVTPLRASGGAVLVLDDITDLRRLETVRRDFVANVSHELRTPVSVIQANAETLLDGALDGPDPEPARRFLGAIHSNAKRLAALIADLLDLARIEAGRERLELAPVRVADALSRAVAALEPGAGAGDIALTVEDPGPVSVLADPGALDQILVNLVDNAVKYTPAGGTVGLRAVVGPDSVRIEVADDGPGVPAAHRTRLFERFYRVDAGRSRTVGGTGLGLAIVKHLAAAMAGTCGMAPNDPAGSIFWVELPAAD